VLKLHAAGDLGPNGSLFSRGIVGEITCGDYWSSTPASAGNGWFLFFDSNTIYISAGNMTAGFPLRCLNP
jgi:hypothetical protein